MVDIVRSPDTVGDSGAAVCDSSGGGAEAARNVGRSTSFEVALNDT